MPGGPDSGETVNGPGGTSDSPVSADAVMVGFTGTSVAGGKDADVADKEVLA